MAIEIDLNEKYKLLCAQDRVIMHHFEDKNISDDEYFHYGIYSDVIVNSISIIINLITQNEDSLGIDNNCRSILEAFSILELEKSGGIGLENKKMYRLFYTSVEKNNFKGEAKARNEVDQKIIDETSENYKKLQDIACEHYKCSVKDLEKSHKFGDPYFYLTNKLNEKTNILSIVNKYHVDIDNHSYIYGFFSMMIHPRCESDDNVEKFILNLRHGFIGDILEKVFNFVDNTLPKVDTSDIQTVDEVLFGHPELRQMLQSTIDVFDKAIATLNGRAGYYANFFLVKMSSLVSDMLLCVFLGFNEMVTSKFKTFIEYYSVLNYLLRSDSKEIRIYRTVGFVVGSRLQMNIFILKYAKSKDEDKIPMMDDITFLYDSYYKDVYSLNSIDEFISGLSNKSLYALYKKPPSYSRMVKDELSLNSDGDYERILQLYNISLDMEHASGYNFNQSPMIAELYANESIYICMKLVTKYLAWIKMLLTDNGMEVDFSSEYNFLDFMMLTFSAKEVEIGEKYTNLANEYYSKNDSEKSDA